MLPGVDNMVFECMGTSFLDPASYETVCKWCAKSGNLMGTEGSSGTNTLHRVKRRSDSRGSLNPRVLGAR